QPGTLTVTPATLTVTADNQTKVYGQPNPVLTAHFSGFVNGDTAAVLSGAPALSTAPAGSGVGTNAITRAAGTLSTANSTFASPPPPPSPHQPGPPPSPPPAPTPPADNQAKVYGQPTPPLTARFSGFVNGDTAASLTTPPVLSTTAADESVLGTYAITVSGAS